jgi:hypothetical protein
MIEALEELIKNVKEVNKSLEWLVRETKEKIEKDLELYEKFENLTKKELK